ncbi:hypothetical protein L596_012405 [Steinernema carpocapsae]|uniref:BPTI/Kunitz inhibitor domain-containing protein n=1 Tax=Steinernema carpocapsae TaxID=34508 RepID=A0A4U5NXU4_STECR|nr:hypothetical protein L596_012405 [Steinernema carpocapsae]
MLNGIVLLALLGYATADYYGCSAEPDSGSGNNFVQKFYFDPVWFTCFAFKYGGVGGNQNRYDSRQECEHNCKPMDGPVCSGPGKNYADPIFNGPPTYPMWCGDAVSCPANYSCFNGMGFPSCCLTSNEEAFAQGNAETCPNGAPALGVDQGYFLATVGHTCNDLICGSGYACQQVNQYFAKCCQV